MQVNNKKLKIVFFGTPDFAVASLDALHSAGVDIAAVVTMPDKPAGRGLKVIPSAVKRYAVDHGLPVLQPQKLKDPGFVEELRAIGADLFIVIAFRMLPEVVWSMPPLGTFNLHGSLLPRYRGAAPINRAIMNGDTVTGVTTFFLRHEIDTGNIIDRESIAIGPDDTAGDVHDRLMALGARLTLATVRRIEAGNLAATPQADIADMDPCPAPKIFSADCRINWDAPAAAIHNHVRGLSPYPGAWTTLIAESAEPLHVKVFATRPTDVAASSAPGTLHISGGRLLADTATTQIEILTLQPQGKRRMTAAEYLRGTRTPLLRVE